jgi:hypothetical protein
MAPLALAAGMAWAAGGCVGRNRVGSAAQTEGAVDLGTNAPVGDLAMPPDLASDLGPDFVPADLLPLGGPEFGPGSSADAAAPDLGPSDLGH